LGCLGASPGGCVLGVQARGVSWAAVHVLFRSAVGNSANVMSHQDRTSAALRKGVVHGSHEERLSVDRGSSTESGAHDQEDLGAELRILPESFVFTQMSDQPNLWLPDSVVCSGSIVPAVFEDRNATHRPSSLLAANDASPRTRACSCTRLGSVVGRAFAGGGAGFTGTGDADEAKAVLLVPLRCWSSALPGQPPSRSCRRCPGFGSARSQHPEPRPAVEPPR